MTGYHVVKINWCSAGTETSGMSSGGLYWKRHTLSKLVVDSFLLSTTKRGDNALGSIHPSVRLSVCMSELSCLNPFAECSKEQRRVIISPRCLSVCGLIARMRSISF